MFELPIETALLVFGFPLFWIGYLAVFMVLSRDWDGDKTTEEEAP